MFIPVSAKNLVVAVQQSAWYATLLIILALSSGFLLIYEWWPGKSEVVLGQLLQFDFYVACFFLGDFLLGLYVSYGYASRWVYFKKNWMNLIASIPVTTEVTQLLRLLRIWRAWRVVRLTIGVWSMRRWFRKKDNGNTR